MERMDGWIIRAELAAEAAYLVFHFWSKTAKVSVP